MSITSNGRQPRILMVAPEISFLPDRQGLPHTKFSARTGGLGDMAATLIKSLYSIDADIHVALPNYRSIFAGRRDPGETTDLPRERIHLVQDRCFYYLPKLFADTGWDNVKIALAFQREVINRIIPEIRPDLIHCHDWMTGLIPAMARQLGIPCLFTLYNPNSARLYLSVIEERGIDAAAFWRHCYYSRMPVCYEETRGSNPVDLLLSGVFSANHVHMPSRSFAFQMMDPTCTLAAPALQRELAAKYRSGCLSIIDHAPGDHLNPATDSRIYRRYGPANHGAGKAFNKLHLQERLGLRMDSKAPMIYWPTRLGAGRQGCRLMADLLPCLLSRYAGTGLQIVFVADGDLHHHFQSLARQAGAADRVAVRDFSSDLRHAAYAAADFILMAVQYEPCGMPCKIGQRYGAIPIGHDTGAIHDTLTHLDMAAGSGNGFIFKNLDAPGLAWGIDQAMAFFGLPDAVKADQVNRIMTESLVRHNPVSTALACIDLYERLLQRPFDIVQSKKCRKDGLLLSAA